jgi:hypothetical protein
MNSGNSACGFILQDWRFLQDPICNMKKILHSIGMWKSIWQCKHLFKMETPHTGEAVIVNPWNGICTYFHRKWRRNETYACNERRIKTSEFSNDIRFTHSRQLEKWFDWYKPKTVYYELDYIRDFLTHFFVIKLTLLASCVFYRCDYILQM